MSRIFHCYFDVVHMYSLENFRRYFSRLYFGLDGVAVGLGHVTRFALGHVISHVRVHVLPIDPLFQGQIHFLIATVHQLRVVSGQQGRL